MHSTKPTVVISPGAWMYPDIFGKVISLFNDAGFPAEALAHPTIGAEPPNKTLYDDVASFRSRLVKLADEGKDIVVVCHSYGGCVGACAVEGLGAVQRAQAGKKGGVVMVVFMTAFAIPKGKSLLDMLGGQWLPWMRIDGDYVRTGPETFEFYFDLPEADKQYWGKRQTHTSRGAFTNPVTYEPWNDMPCMYIICEGDEGLSQPVQEHMSTLLGPDAILFRIRSGHFPFLSVPSKIVEGVALGAKTGMEKKAIALGRGGRL